MMKRMWTMSLTGLCLAVLLVSDAWAQSSARSRPAATPPPPTDAEPPPRQRSRELELPTGPAQPTRLQLAILELACPTGIVAGIDLQGLVAGNATPEAILERLGQFGEATTVRRIDSLINLTSQTEITQGSRVPTVRNVVVSAGGVVTPSVSYEKVGTIVKIRGQWRQDDAQLADVVCTITTSGIMDSPIRVASDVILPVFNELSVKQTLQVRHGQPTCALLSGIPQAHEGNSVVQLHVLYLMLTRAGEAAQMSQTATEPPAPQTMVQAAIYEITGEKEKLAQIDLGKEPPADPAKLQESLGWYGKVREVARPSLLAVWPSKSTIITGWKEPVIPEQAATQSAETTSSRARRTISYRRVQFEFTADGRWSDAAPQEGKVTIELTKRQQVGQNREMVAKDAITSTANIENNKPLYVIGDVMSADGQDQARRYVICLTARRIEQKESAPAENK